MSGRRPERAPPPRAAGGAGGGRRGQQVAPATMPGSLVNISIVAVRTGRPSPMSEPSSPWGPAPHRTRLGGAPGGPGTAPLEGGLGKRQSGPAAAEQGGQPPPPLGYQQHASIQGPGWPSRGPPHRTPGGGPRAGPGRMRRRSPLGGGRRPGRAGAAGAQGGGRPRQTLPGQKRRGARGAAPRRAAGRRGAASGRKPRGGAGPGRRRPGPPGRTQTARARPAEKRAARPGATAARPGATAARQAARAGARPTTQTTLSPDRPCEGPGGAATRAGGAGEPRHRGAAGSARPGRGPRHRGGGRGASDHVRPAAGGPLCWPAAGGPIHGPIHVCTVAPRAAYTRSSFAPRAAYTRSSFAPRAAYTRSSFAPRAAYTRSSFAPRPTYNRCPSRAANTRSGSSPRAPHQGRLAGGPGAATTRAEATCSDGSSSSRPPADAACPGPGRPPVSQGARANLDSLEAHTVLPRADTFAQAVPSLAQAELGAAAVFPRADTRAGRRPCPHASLSARGARPLPVHGDLRRQCPPWRRPCPEHCPHASLSARGALPLPVHMPSAGLPVQVGAPGPAPCVPPPSRPGPPSGPGSLQAAPAPARPKSTTSNSVPRHRRPRAGQRVLKVTESRMLLSLQFGLASYHNSRTSRIRAAADRARATVAARHPEQQPRHGAFVPRAAAGAPPPPAATGPC